MSAQSNPYQRDAQEQTASHGSKATPVLCVLLAIAVAVAGYYGVQYSKTSTELADLQAQYADLSESLDAAAKTLNDMTALAESTAAACEEAEGALAEMTARQEETAGKLAETEKALTDMTAQAEQMAQGRANAEADLVSMTKMQQETAAALEEMTQKHGEATDALAAVSGELETAKAGLDTAKAELDSANELLAQAQAKQADSDNIIANLTAMLAEAEEQLAAAAAQQTEEAPAWPVVNRNDDGSFTVETERAVVTVWLDESLKITAIEAAVAGIPVADALTAQFVGQTMPMDETAVTMNDGVFVPEVFAALYALSIAPAPAAQ